MSPTDSKPTKSVRSCPKCGSVLASDALNGLCPNCLVLVTFDQESADTVVMSAPPATEAAGSTAEPKAVLSPTLRYFGDYELLEEVARGGMGVVYKARQVKLNRIVAVKMILGGQLASPTEIHRFLTEAEAAANLQHPNIVAIHEVGEHEGRHYFSMDYVEGQNLADYAKANPLPAARAAQLIKTIAEAIHFAHQRGTLHRDLKPQNVLIDAAGQPRITDFGLAKRYGVPPSGGSGLQPAKAGTTNELTQTGAVMGSPSYMSPEQAAGKNEQVGPSSDVYSIGAMLYHLLTGRTPFVAETPLATLRKVMEEEPAAPSKLNSQTPPDLETICLKCLEKRPERRYHSARELAEELDRFLNHEPILAKPASAWRKAWTWSLRNPWAIIGAAAMAGIVLLGLAYGLWERVKYFEGGTPPESDNPFSGVLAIGYFVMLAAVLFGHWQKGRRQRNLPVSNLQLALLTGSGLLLIASGLWTVMEWIRLYVWKKPFFDSLAALGAWCLGFPLLFCWVGGILIWQAIRRQQAYWSGSTVAEAEWLPRQALHYSTVAFVTATFANLILFVSFAYLGIATGLFNAFLNVVGHSHDGKSLLVTCFALIALGVSTACWVYATRKVYKRPPLVSVFLGVLFLGAMVGWFSVPPYSLLPATFVFTSMLAGLAGGWVLVKWVKIRKEEPAEPPRPLALGELFQWDHRAFLVALAVVTIALGSLDSLFFSEGVEVSLMFLLFTVENTLWPPLILAVRATTGRMREFFLSMLLLLTIFVFGPCLAGVGLSDDPPEVKSTLVGLGLTCILIGNAAGCALIYFGKIRPKAR